MAREHHYTTIRWCISVFLLLSSKFAIALSAEATRDEPQTTSVHGAVTVPDFVLRYAPLVWLHSEDPFRPADLTEHLRHTTPMVDQRPVSDFPEPNLNNLAELNKVSKKVALTSKDDVTELPEWLFGGKPDEHGKIHDATPCVVVMIQKDEHELDAFFFYFYSYDRGANLTQVVEPLNRLLSGTEQDMHFGDHVGDWEHNMVRFKDGKPTGIYYSNHEDGYSYDWTDESLEIRDERPLVYSAYGSHANYATPGTHTHDTVLLDFCDAGLLWDPVLSAYFYAYDPSKRHLTRVLPSDNGTSVETDLTSFFFYEGRWGDMQYPDNHPLQKTVPFFGLKRFVTGPQGPIFKHLVRKGLAPDRTRVKPWMQRAVKLFMAFYPCCIRGWRLYVSLTVMAISIALLVFGIKRGMKIYRKRGGYKRLEADIPMEDMEVGEEPASREEDTATRR